MKKTLFAFLLIFLILLPSAMYSQSAKTRILGIIMGISKYQNMTSLKYADRDAMSFYCYLLSPAGGSADTNNIRLLLNEKATSYNFFEAMESLIDMAQEGDQVYIYFAGHGDIEKKTDKQNGFLIGYNAPPNCYAAGGCIGVGYLHDYVEKLVSTNGAKVTMIIDACRSGKLAGGDEGVEITALALKADWKGVTKILSCQPGETSLEGERWGGGAGVFSYFLLKGMLGQADKDGDGIVTVLELNNYLDENVLRETNRTQLPEIIGDKRQNIARIDKRFSADFLSKLESSASIKPGIQAAGFEADISSINDIDLLKEYEKFKNLINNDNLKAHNDAENDIQIAYSIYQAVINRRSAQPIITKMKGDLLAALQNRAQISINKYMESEISLINIKSSADSINREITYKELKEAMNIADSSYSQYSQLKFRYLFYSHLIEKEADKKQKILDECLKISPNEPIVLNAIGLICYNNKKYNEAIIYFQKASELAPTWSYPWYNKGTTENQLGRFEESLKYFDKAIELKPKHHNAWYNKGNSLNDLGRYEEAINCYDKAIELNLKDDETWGNKGRALSKLGKNEEAINCYNKAIELKPDEYTYWQSKACTLLDLGKNAEAIICFDKVIELKPDVHFAWGNKGYALANLGTYDEAIKCYNKVIELKPDDSYTLYNKACSRSLMKNKPEMLKSLKKAIELNPELKEYAKKDNDFKEYWDDPDFKELLK